MTFSIETSLAAGIEAIEAQIFSDGQASSISENRKGSQDALLEVLQQAELTQSILQTIRRRHCHCR